MGIGEACAVGSALTWSGGVIIYKRLGEILPPLQLNLLKNVIVLLVLVPTLLLTPGTGWPSLPPIGDRAGDAVRRDRHRRSPTRCISARSTRSARRAWASSAICTARS